MTSTKLNTETIPIRMADELYNSLKQAAERLETSQQNTARLAMQIGLRDLEAIDFDVAGAVYEKARGKRSKSPAETSARPLLNRRTKQRQSAPVAPETQKTPAAHR